MRNLQVVADYLVFLLLHIFSIHPINFQLWGLCESLSKTLILPSWSYFWNTRFVFWMSVRDKISTMLQFQILNRHSILHNNPLTLTKLLFAFSFYKETSLKDNVSSFMLCCRKGDLWITNFALTSPNKFHIIISKMFLILSCLARIYNHRIRQIINMLIWKY